jgi:hypothetical protein
VGFGSKTVNVAVFKPVSSVADAAAAHQWSVSYQTVVARTLRQFAGSHHLVRAGAASRPPVSADGVDLTGASDGREHVSLT